jgi:predicted RNase H-like HicB family nuclease
MEVATGYTALVRKEAKSDFSVEFPDFPGCVTAGKTLEEARQFAQEALELHLQGMVEDGEEVPEPSPLDQVLANPENRDAFGFVVFVKTSGRHKRINISFPGDLLAEIDAFAQSAGMTRSGFLAQAAREKLAPPRASKPSRSRSVRSR